MIRDHSSPGKILYLSPCETQGRLQGTARPRPHREAFHPQRLVSCCAHFWARGAMPRARLALLMAQRDVCFTPQRCWQRGEGGLGEQGPLPDGRPRTGNALPEVVVAHIRYLPLRPGTQTSAHKVPHCWPAEKARARRPEPACGLDG